VVRGDLDSVTHRHGPDIDHVKANWAIYVRRYDDTRAGSRHREPCPNRRRPHTSIPALTLHRRSGPTEPLHCIYNLGLGVVAQGDKQVLLGEESIDYGPGQSMLTTIDLPVVSHVTRASGAEPFLGMMLTLDVRSIVQMASEMDEHRPRRENASRSISFEALDADLLDALIRLVKLLGQPALVPGLAPLIQQEAFSAC
jgi:hypothetical protein